MTIGRCETEPGVLERAKPPPKGGRRIGFWGAGVLGGRGLNLGVATGWTAATPSHSPWANQLDAGSRSLGSATGSQPRFG